MNTNSTDFACLVTGFLTDYLPHHRCYSKNTILSYRDTLKLFLRFIKEEKGILLNSFYIRDFKRELVIFPTDDERRIRQDFTADDLA